MQGLSRQAENDFPAEPARIRCSLLALFTPLIICTFRCLAPSWQRMSPNRPYNTLPVPTHNLNSCFLYSDWHTSATSRPNSNDRSTDPSSKTHFQSQWNRCDL